MTPKLVFEIGMLIWGEAQIICSLLHIPSFDFTVGTVWLVGSILLIWMPEK